MKGLQRTRKDQRVLPFASFDLMQYFEIFESKNKALCEHRGPPRNFSAERLIKNFPQFVDFLRISSKENCLPSLTVTSLVRFFGYERLMRVFPTNAEKTLFFRPCATTFSDFFSFHFILKSHLLRLFDVFSF